MASIEMLPVKKHPHTPKAKPNEKFSRPHESLYLSQRTAERPFPPPAIG